MSLPCAAAQLRDRASVAFGAVTRLRQPASRLAAACRAPYPERMDDAHASLARIDAALARIEAAARARSAATESLARRHAALRERTAEALAALDAVIAREDQG